MALVGIEKVGGSSILWVNLRIGGLIVYRLRPGLMRVELTILCWKPIVVMPLVLCLISAVLAIVGPRLHLALMLC